MANDEADLENDVDEEDEAKGGSKKLIIIIAAVVLIGGGAAAFFLIGGDSEESAEGETVEEVVEVKEAIYVGVPNAITANLQGAKRARTVQIKMSFLVRSEEAKSNVKTHMPQLKNDVLMLVSQKNADDLKLPDGRQKLQQEALETVQKTLTGLVKDPTVEKVLFVSFVMQ
ncbi:MAG: flagellar FliL protein [Polaribacter sp.]|jgi:flagellar FliL protein